MSNIKLNCCGCGKELGLGDRVSTDGVLWRCEECAIKQREEYENKDKKIADLEAKLADMTEKYNACQEARKLEIEFSMQDKKELRQQLAEKEKDKIDYAVEQLERVKEKLEERIEIIEENEREGFCDRKQGLDMWQENKSAIKIIDQIITEIKDGK